MRSPFYFPLCRNRRDTAVWLCFRKHFHYCVGGLMFAVERYSGGSFPIEPGAADRTVMGELPGEPGLSSIYNTTLFDA